MSKADMYSRERLLGSDNAPSALTRRPILHAERARRDGSGTLATEWRNASRRVSFSHVMVTRQIGAEANSMNLALDELKGSRGRRSRRRLLGQALFASQRGLEELRNEPLVTRTASYVTETMERYWGNELAVAEELRMDKATIRWFVKAEC